MTLAARVCKRNETTAAYTCQHLNTSFLLNLDLPADSCDVSNCNSCIKATRTYILDDTNNLRHPSRFFERPTQNRGDISTLICYSSDDRGDTPVPCDCSENCTGSDEFCSTFRCVTEAPCKCDVRKMQYELSHITSNHIIFNPTLLSMQICLFRLPVKSRKSRHILEYEGATFSQHNLTIIFNDPVVTLPEPGKLIVRVSGNEIIIPIEQDLSITLPAEFVSFKDTLTLIFISKTGKAVHGDISLEGKTICRLASCFFCREFLLHMKCWPPYVSYIFYGLIVIWALLVLCFLKWTCQGLLVSLHSLTSIIFTFLKFIKSLLRFFLLVGAVFGNTFRQYINSFLQFLERQNLQLRPVQANQLIVLCGLIGIVYADCTTHAILNSDIQNCQIQNDVKICELFTTAEITLKGLGFESCIWFQDKANKNIFHMKLKLVSAQCSFSSKRKYFTFPVTQNTVSQLACPQNYYCAWGEHCKNDKHFEALTEESLDYPGFTKCEPSSVGSGCTIISRMGCLFYRVYFIPDLLHSYEVRSILGHQCTYTISVNKILNDTTERLTFHTSAVTSDGIHLEILGAYNQAPIHFTDSLVLRVGDHSEAYLVPSSPSNRPTAGLVGQVQANTSFTKQFLFDHNMVKCNFFETTLRCEKVSDALETMYKSNERALPLTHDLHMLSVDKGTLKSRLLSTAPVRLQLHFRDYKIMIESADVCSKITDSAIHTKGCYACQILSEMVFTAFSTCHAGSVTIEFQVLTLFTQTIILLTEPKEFNIKFLADQKCYDEKICLASRNMKHCQKISFCLNEPSLHLIQLNTSYTKSFLKDDSLSSGFFSVFALPKFKNVFHSLKMLGDFLLIICLTITIFSTCMTCCRK